MAEAADVVSRHPKSFLVSGRPRAFAHRGDRAGHPPGNTPAAFSAALDLGVDHIETDAHLTADGVVVLFHDDLLDHATTGSGPVRDHTWAELRELRHCHDGQVVEGSFVRFDEALEHWPDAFWNVDAKSDDVVEPLLRAVHAAAAEERVLVTSFSVRSLRRIRRQADPSLATGLAKLEIALVRLLAWARLPAPHLGDAAQVPTDHRRIEVVDRRFVDTCHRAGIAVHVWTINDASEMHRLLDLGVDGVITDDPAMLADVLRERGEWRVGPQ